MSKVEKRISLVPVAHAIANVLIIVRIGTDVDGLLFIGGHLDSFLKPAIDVEQSKVAHLFISHIRVA